MKSIHLFLSLKHIEKFTSVKKHFYFVMIATGLLSTMSNAQVDFSSTSTPGNVASAIGVQTRASGDASTALGLQTTASGLASTSSGFKTTAMGAQSFAAGNFSIASGDFSFAIGDNTSAVGRQSFAAGLQTKADGDASTALGYGSSASGIQSFAAGHWTLSSGSYSFALGTRAYTENDHTMAFGVDIKAQNNRSMIIGTGAGNGQNDIMTNNIPNSLMVGFNSSAPTLFVGSSNGGSSTGNVGIGTSTPSSNLHVKKKGATNPAGAAGNWAAKIENNLDTPGENGLFVANRWGLDDSTVFEAGSWWNGSTEAYTPVLTVTGGRKVGIGTNIPSEKLTVNGNILFGDGDRSNSGDSGLGIEWHTSSYGSGFGHKIYAIDPSGRTDLRFAVRHSSGTWSDAMTIASTGKVAIGTTNMPDQIGNGTNISAYKLYVAGGILTEEVRVRTGWADYVFADDYNLQPLEEVEAYIKENKHLPNVPSAKVIEEEGLELGDISRIQQEKIEELTLYLIAQQKQIDALKAMLYSLTNEKN